MGENSSQTSRRSFLKAGAGVIGSAALTGNSLPLLASDRAGAPRPNFVFFLGEGVRADQLSIFQTDGWNGSGLSVQPNHILSTPHLNRIVREGISFRNAFVTNALCLPSRASILTGLYGHETGCVDNRARKIPDDVPTIADMLREAGYEVAFFGKIHIHDMSKRYWDYFFGFEAAGADYYHPSIIESKRGDAKPPRRFSGYVDDILTARALNWLNQKREKPFCLFLWFTAPHAPFYRSRRHLDLYNGVPVPKPSTFDDDLKGYPGKPLAFIRANNKIGTTVQGNDDPRSLEEIVKDHCAGIVSNDDNAASVMAALEKAGILDDTAIILSSDHGFFLGEWRFYDKRFMHEPSSRVPLAIRYPRRISAGVTSSAMALNIDIPPTILDLAGIKIPDWFQGQSLAPFFSGGAAPSTWRKDWLYEYFEYPEFEHVPPHRGVRTDRYKLIHYFLAPEQFELYDLQADPGELHNLADDPAHAQLKQQLLERIAELRRETGDDYQYQEPGVFEQQREQMDPAARS